MLPECARPQIRSRRDRALFDFERDGVGFHWRLRRETTSDFVFAGRDWIEVVVAAIPDDFECPIAVRPDGFLSYHLGEEHPARPSPYFLACRSVHDRKVIGLA